MKKIYFIILLFFISIINVEASNLSLKTLKENMLKSDIYHEFTEEGATCTISTSNTYFNISCKLGTEGTYKTDFAYNKGILSYKFDGNRNNSQTYEETLFDTFWLVEVANCIANYYGLDIGSNMLERVETLTQNNYTLAKNGVESTYFQYSVGQESGYAFDTFKIYVNDGTIKEESSTNSSSNSNSNSSSTTNSGTTANNNTNSNSGNNNTSSSTSSSNATDNTSNNQTNSTQNSNSSFDTNEEDEELTYEAEQQEDDIESSNNTNNNINNTTEKEEQENNKKDNVFSIKNIFKNDSESDKNINVDLILIILIIVFGSIFIFLITRKPKN